MLPYHIYRPASRGDNTYTDTKKVYVKPEFLDESIVSTLFKLSNDTLHGVDFANFGEYISAKYLFEGPHKKVLADWLSKKLKGELRILYIWDGDARSVAIAHRTHNESIRKLYGAAMDSELPILELCVNYEPGRSGAIDYTTKYHKIYGCNGDGDVRNYEGYKSIISDIRTKCLEYSNTAAEQHKLDRTPIDMIIVKHAALLPVGLETLKTGGMMIIYNFHPHENCDYMETEDCLHAPHKLIGSIIHLFESCKYLPIGETGILLLESFKSTSVTSLKVRVGKANIANAVSGTNSNSANFGIPDPTRSVTPNTSIWKVIGNTDVTRSPGEYLFGSGLDKFTEWYKEFVRQKM